ncbi:MAG: hypothetical protein ACU0B7_01020 [Paracoccaceae bacterium]|uniref:hypothetical protein n=1 Tax=Seohaeicola saemankumensis TaxID=481181 RepID=UPI002E7BF3E1|nr:hypothetical protein [Seohaeicola saemankumensis]
MDQDRLDILVGTTKGLFVVSDKRARQDWQVSGPFCDGWPISHAVGDPVTGTYWAGGGSDGYWA